MITKENITGKQRAYLRSLANGVPAIFQMGKEGISDNLIKQLSDALTARELIKIHVLENCELTPREASDQLSDILEAIPVQTIGSKVVLYRRSDDEKKRTIVIK